MILLSFFQKIYHAKWFAFWLLLITIFFRCVFFHWFCFNTILLSSIFLHPIDAFLFYYPKILASLFIASFVFIFKKQWWSIIVLLLIDIWILANLIYFRANGLLIDVNAILMIGNLSGFETSIGAYFLPKFLIFPITFLVYTALIILIGSTNQRLYKHFFCSLFLFVASNIASCIPNFIWAINNKEDLKFDLDNGRKIIYQMYGRTGLRVFEPYHDIKLSALPELTYDFDYAKKYVYDNSIIHYLGAIGVYYWFSDSIDKSTIDKNEVAALFNNETIGITYSPKSNLIMILVESFESWPLDIPSSIVKSPSPYINTLINHPNTIYFNNIRSQAKHGVSGDGQMTLCSGLLPIHAGAACMLYGGNIYPNIASNYEHSVFIDIANNGCWNQRVMTEKYGFNFDCYSNDTLWDDKIVFEQLCNVLDTIEEPYCILLLTGAMHSPFNRYSCQHLDTPLEMPKYLTDYLECLYVTDSCFGIFWNKFKDSELLNNTNIIVTGDHTVFKAPILRNFNAFAEKHKWTIPTQESFCPLIIYSPYIEGNIHVVDTCYQMDIYPTMMHLIGCENYYWKGFGINLLDSTTRQKRPFSEQEAYRLSDIMIRNNYFQHYQNSQN